MKKLIGILSLILVFSFTSNAQQNKKKMGEKADFSPEQIAILQTKKMDLHLDLSNSQEKAVFKLIESQAIERKKARDEFKSKREKGNKPTSAERFEHQNTRLDKQIEHKAAIKNILSDEQFTKWEETAKKRMKTNKKNGSSQGQNNGEQQNRKFKNRS